MSLLAVINKWHCCQGSWRNIIHVSVLL